MSQNPKNNVNSKNQSIYFDDQSCEKEKKTYSFNYSISSANNNINITMDDNIPKDNTKILDEILSDEEKKEALIAQVQEENPFLKSVNSVNNQALDMVIESDKLPKEKEEEPEKTSFTYSELVKKAEEFVTRNKTLSDRNFDLSSKNLQLVAENEQLVAKNKQLVAENEQLVKKLLEVKKKEAILDQKISLFDQKISMFDQKIVSIAKKEKEL